jgi:polyphosphate kinase
MIKSVGRKLDIDSDLSKSMLEKISTSVKRIGEPVRFIYDKMIEKTP